MDNGCYTNTGVLFSNRIALMFIPTIPMRITSLGSRIRGRQQLAKKSEFRDRGDGFHQGDAAIYSQQAFHTVLAQWRTIVTEHNTLAHADCGDDVARTIAMSLLDNVFLVMPSGPFNLYTSWRESVASCVNCMIQSVSCC